ncbi:substrate-binding domain-containing protein [Eubacteriales bacterium mix99]|jgi:LacI family transcriptional regulator
MNLPDKSTEHIPIYIQEQRILKKKIINGDFGVPGSHFVTTRELADTRGISLVTAQRVLVGLKDERLIELHGKKYYLTHGRIAKDTPLGRLQNNNTKLLGFHITNIGNPFFSSLAKAAEKSVMDAGYKLVTASSSYQIAQERSILEIFRDIGAMGVLSCPGVDQGTASLYQNYVLPHVFLGRKPEGTNAEAVLVNNTPAARRVAEHFIDEGYQSFAYIGLSDLRTEQDPRLSGFREGLVRKGHALPPNHILGVDIGKDEKMTEDITDFLAALPKPAAVFCFHDMIGVRVLQACQDSGILCPQMVAVAGFDNLSISSLVKPALTTVSYGVEDMAETAVRLLIDQVETRNEKKGTNYYLEPSLIIRESSSKRAVRKHPHVPMHDLLYKVSE